MYQASAVLSIQSWVSYGYVGSAVAVFALQRMGFEVWPVHTARYSSHLGYAGCRGGATPVEECEALLEGLGQVGAMASLGAVVTGFLGSAAHWSVVERALGEAPTTALRVCDPVMGDQGRFYVPQELVAVYQREALQCADVLTPNQFELGVLSGSGASTGTRQEALEAAAVLSARSTRGALVVGKGIAQEGDAAHLWIVAARGSARWVVRSPRIQRGFTGSGDLFTAVLTAQLMRGREVGEALRLAASITLDVLEVTACRPPRQELALIEAQRCFGRDVARDDIVLEALP